MLTLSQFELLSGSQALACLSEGEFATVRDIMEQRLMESLCLETSPDTEETPDLLWQQLLADALAISVLVKQDDGIQSENMRNYSYQFRDYAGSWEMLSNKSGDLLNKYNACETGIVFQTDIARRIYGYEYPCGRCGNCHECI
jgi:hypothetical protein